MLLMWVGRGLLHCGAVIGCDYFLLYLDYGRGYDYKGMFLSFSLVLG
jgi:hypothetical protein